MIKNNSIKKLTICFSIFLFSITKNYAYDLELKISSFGDFKYNFSFLKFIDARLNTTKPVGFTRVGISNKTEELVLPKRFAAYCDSAFHSGNMIFNADLKIIPVIEQITVQETHSSGNEYSTVTIAISYYQSSGDVCNLLYSSFVRVSESNGMDITKKHSKNLSYAFFRSFKELTAFINSGAKPFSTTSIDAAKLPLLLNEQSTATLSENNLKDGIYFSCRQLVINKPNLNYPDLIGKIDTAKTTLQYNEGDSFFKGNSCFAIVKDHKLYLQLRDLSYQNAGIEGNARLGYFKSMMRKNANIGGGIAAIGLGTLFGFVGGVAGSAIKSSTTTYSAIEKMYIDLETGFIDVNP